MKRLTLALILTMCCAFPALAKDKKEDSPTDLVDQLRLTIELKTIENLQLRAVPLEQQLQDLQQQYRKLVAQIEEEHPGYLFNPQSGQLVKKPEPTPQPKPEKK